MASGPLTVTLRINADGSAAIVGLRNVQGALDNTGQATRRASTTTRELLDRYDQAGARARTLARDSAQLNRIIADGGPAADRARLALTNLNTQLDQLHNQGRTANGSIGGLSSSLKSLALTAGAALSVGALAQAFITANIESQRLQKGLTAVAGSATAGAAEMEYISKIADKLGLSLASAGQAYVSLTAATKGTAMEGQATRAIFESISLAMGKLGKSSADTEGALMAIQQMISKGTVSSEELKQQLGERLPGAFRLAAEAIGVTEQQLGKMLEQGQVVATDLLPKLSQKLLKLYDDGTRIGGMGAEWERVKNAANAFFVELDKGTGITGAIATLLSDVAAAFKGMTTSLAESAGSTGIFATTMASLGETIKTTRAELISGEWSESTTLIMAVAGAAAGMAAIMVTLSGAIGLVNTAVAILNGLLAMNPWTAIVLAIGAVAGALYVLKDEFVTIGTTTATVGEFIRGIWETTAAYVQVAWETFINWISPVINELGTKFQVVGDMIAANWQGAMSMVVSAATTSINVLISLFVSAGKTIGNIIGAIAIAWETKTFSWEAIKNAAAEGVAYEDHLGQSGLNLTKIVNEQSIAIKKKVENIRAVNQVESDYAQLERELAADNEKAANAGKGHVKVINEKTLALGGGAAAHKGAAKAANEQEKALDALIKKYLPARDDAKNLEEATAVLDKAMQDGKITGEEYGKMLKGLKKDYNSVENAAQALIDKYDTEGARTRQLAEDRALMAANMADGNLKLEGAAAAMDKLTEAEKKNTKEADAWAEVWKNAVKRIDDTFASLWKDLFSGTKSTLESMKNAILSWLAEVAHALLTKPLVVAITTSMAGGSSVAGAAGQAASGASGLGGLSSFSSIGSMFSTAFQLGSTFLSGVSEGIMGMFSTNMFSTIGTAWGAATSGSAMGAAAGVGVMAAYALPVIAAAVAVFSKWQSDQKPRYGTLAAQTGGRSSGLEDSEWGSASGAYVKGSFGLNFGITDKGSKNMEATELTEVYQAMADVSNALAQFFGPDLSSFIEAELQKMSDFGDGLIHLTENEGDLGGALAALVERIALAAGKSSEDIGIAFAAVAGDLGGTAEEVGKQIEEAMANATILVNLSDNYQEQLGQMLGLTGEMRGDTQLLIGYVNAMKTSGETLGATLQRMVLNMSGLDQAMTLTGTTTDATGQAFVDMANNLAGAANDAGIGMEGLMKLQAYYYDQFYSTTEKATKAMQELLKGINKEWPKLKEKMLWTNDKSGNLAIPGLKESLVSAYKSVNKQLEIDWSVPENKALMERLYSQWSGWKDVNEKEPEMDWSVPENKALMERLYSQWSGWKDVNEKEPEMDWSVPKNKALMERLYSQWSGWKPIDTEIVGGVDAKAIDANARAALRAAQMYTEGVSQGTITKSAETEARIQAALNSYADEISKFGIDVSKGLMSIQDQINAIGNIGFMTEADRQSLQKDPNAEIYAKLVNDMPKSRDEFEKLIGQIDVTTESGAMLYAEIMKLVPAFDAMYDSIESFEKWLGVTDETALATKRLEKVFADLGLDMPTTKAALLELYNSGVLTAEMMATLGVNLEDLSLVFKDAASDITDLFAAQRETLRGMADQLDPNNPLSQQARDDALEALRKAGYQGSLYDAKGIAAFLRALAELDDAGGEAGKELQKFLETFTGVFGELARIAEERAGLEMRLLELTGTDAEILAAKRRLEMAAIDATNRALLERIYALEDARLAMDTAFAALERAINAEREAVNAEYQRRVDAINAERDAAQAAYDARTKAINAEREAIATAHQARLDAINAEREALQTQISAAQEALSKIEGILGSVQSALDSIRGQLAVSDIALAAARQQLASWASQGVLPDQEAFDRVMGTLNRDDKGNYASATAYRANQQATYANLLELERLGLAQKTDAEQQLEALEAQNDALDAQITQADQINQDQLQALDDQLAQAEAQHREHLDELDRQLQAANDWRDGELARLDAILADAKERLEIALGTYQTLISIDEALRQLAASIAAYQAPPPDESPASGEYRGWDPEQQVYRDPVTSQDAISVTRAASLDDLRAEIVELRTVIASVGTAQITPLKSIDDRLRKFDTDGLPPGRDDVILLRAA